MDSHALAKFDQYEIKNNVKNTNPSSKILNLVTLYRILEIKISCACYKYIL